MSPIQVIIKMGENKLLHIVSLIKVYKNENNADELLFLLPQTYGTKNIRDCKVVMNWINKDQHGGQEELNFSEELFKDTHLQAIVPLTIDYTQVTGNILI